MNTAENGKVLAKRKTAKRPHGIQGGSSEANRFAVVILEVLAGGRTPTDASEALGISLPRYYQLETRALQGLVAALEPRPIGRQQSAKHQIAGLERMLQQARREGLRQQALVRAAQRSLGIRPPVVAELKAHGKDGLKRKRRRPAIRALKAAKALASATPRPDVDMLQQQHSATHPGPSVPERDGKPPGTTPIVAKGPSP
jgi:hypothetical protein